MPLLELRVSPAPAMTVTYCAPAGAVRLNDLVDAVAHATGAWLLIEELGAVVCHGVGSGPCGPSVASALLSKSTRPLREAVRWQRGCAPLTGLVDGQSVTAVDLGEGGLAWFIGGGAVTDSTAALAAALHGSAALPYDPFVADLLHPRGPNRLGGAPQARLVALQADVPLQGLCRVVAAVTATTSVRTHVEDDIVLLALDPQAEAEGLVENIALRCSGTAAGFAVTPAGANDWRSTADIAQSAMLAARELDLLLADADDSAVAAEILVREAAHSVSILSGQLRATPLQALRAHDARTCGELVATLTAWCRVGFDTSRAAAELHVHVNTLRYRLKRAAALSGLRLDQPRQRLALQLMLLE